MKERGVRMCTRVAKSACWAFNKEREELWRGLDPAPALLFEADLPTHTPGHSATAVALGLVVRHTDLTPKG